MHDGGWIDEGAQKQIDRLTNASNDAMILDEGIDG